MGGVRRNGTQSLPSRIAQVQRKCIANKLEQHLAVRLVHNCILCHGLAIVVFGVEVLAVESLNHFVRQLGLDIDSFHWHPSIAAVAIASVAAQRSERSMTTAYTVSVTFAVP